MISNVRGADPDSTVVDFESSEEDLEPEDIELPNCHSNPALAVEASHAAARPGGDKFLKGQFEASHADVRPRKNNLLRESLDLYGYIIERRPGCCLCTYLFILIIIFVARFRNIDVDDDFSSFVVADGDSMRQRDAYLLALAAKKAATGSRRLEEQSGVDHIPIRQLLDSALVSEMAPRRRHRVDRKRPRRLGRKIRSLFTRRRMASKMQHAAAVMPSRQYEVKKRRRLSTVGVVVKDLTMLYEARGGDILDPQVLREVRDLELKLVQLPGWRKLCDRAHKPLSNRCAPGDSFMAYAWPSVSFETSSSQSDSNSTGTTFTTIFNSQGADLFPLAAAFAYLEQDRHPGNDFSNYFPTGYAIPKAGNGLPTVPPVALRTRFTFCIKIGDSTMSKAVLTKNSGQAKVDYDSLMTDEVWPLLQSITAELKHTNLYYQGDTISSYELSRTLRVDATYAIGSIFFVLFYLFAHTRSISLSLSSLIMMVCAIPLAYAVLPAMKITMASFLSIFVIVGIGSDVVFVFFDMWKQSERKVTGSLGARMAWTLAQAGSNCVATTCTTAASFLANLASVLKPLREFGLFMGICVISALVMVFLFLPSVLILLEKHKARRRYAKSSDSFKGTIVIESVKPKPVTAENSALVAVVPEAPAKENFAEQANRPAAAGKSISGVLLTLLINRVEACPLCIVLIFCVAAVGFYIGVFGNAKFAQSVPAIFPSDHNRAEAARIGSLFNNPPEADLSADSVASGGTVCTAIDASSSPTASSQASCILHWCEANSSYHSLPVDASSMCWRGPTHRYNAAATGAGHNVDMSDYSLDACQHVIVQARVAAKSAPSSSIWMQEWPKAVKRLPGIIEPVDIIGDANPKELPHLVLESWDTGVAEAVPFFEMPAAVGNVSLANGVATQECMVAAICFLGDQVCSLPAEWRFMSRLDFPTPTPPTDQRRLLDEQASAYTQEAQPATRLQALHHPPLGHDLRRLQNGGVPEHKRMDVTVLWGIRGPTYTPLVGELEDSWSYDPTFEMSNPWAQRAVRDMHKVIDAASELRVLRKRCWVDDFIDFQRENNDSPDTFPTRSFDAAMATFYSESLSAADHVWFIKGKVLAQKCGFEVDFAWDSATQAVLDYKEHWDRVLSRQNRKASVTANKAYHTASTWVRAEAQVAIVGSTIDTILISALCGCSGMLVFTGDPVLAFYVLLLMIGIIGSLAFFMVVIMDWELGAIEVISLVVFLGYSVTFLLHIAHLYSATPAPPPKAPSQVGELQATPPPPEEMPAADVRRYRTREAVLRVGGATLSSAVSTFGSSLFLLFCTLRIFTKLGTVVIAVTLISVFFALVVLPAILFIAGPAPEAWYERWGVSRQLRRVLALVKSKEAREDSDLT